MANDAVAVCLRRGSSVNLSDVLSAWQFQSFAVAEKDFLFFRRNSGIGNGGKFV